MLYCTLLCCAVLYSTVLNCTLPYSTLPYPTPPYPTLPYSTLLFLNPLLEPLAGDSSTASPIAGNCPYDTLEKAECVTDYSQSAGLSCFNAQQPNAACISTDSKYEIWAKELANDLDRDFILNGIREGFDLNQHDATVLPAFTKNNRSALRPGAKEQIEEQLCKGLSLGHFGSSNTPPHHC